jgi:hypothetical protein
MACLIMEILMIVYGIRMIVKGTFTIMRSPVVYGWPARVVGVLMTLPLPINFAIGLIWGVVIAVQGKEVDFQTAREIAVVEPIVAIAFLFVAMMTGLIFSRIPRYTKSPGGVWLA